ncbi:MAG: autotransporter domain-containing protein [Calditrichia bacterium]|nr:autotransporter domain-containing protein [Calditrichia bacterium]
MKKRLAIIIAILIMSQIGFSQIAEKVSIFFSAGGTAAQESVIGKNFVFPQLSRDTGTDFATYFLGYEPNSENIQEYWHNGFNLGGGLIWKLNSYLAVSTDFYYNFFTFNESRLSQDIGTFLQDTSFFSLPYNENGLTISQGTLNIYELSLNLRAQYPFEKVRPYIVGGMGYMHIRQNPININYNDDFNIYPGPQQANVSFFDQIPGQKLDALMFNAGFGVVVQLSKNVQPFLQANGVLGSTTGQNTIYYNLKFGFAFTLR